MNENFLNGFVKQAEAKEGPEGHHLRRFLLGNPISSAIEAKKGEKTKAFGHAWAHTVKNRLAGAGIGAGAGGLIGAGIGGLKGGKEGAKALGSLGLLGGAGIGNMIGAIKGNHGAEASKIHGQYSKHKK